MDCIHQLDECEECGGLKVTTWTPISLGSFELDGDSINEAVLYIAPVDEPCPNPSRQEC